ncbi:MAG: anti-sigma factor RsiW, partial [Paracoccaceae bacterium]
ALEVDFTPIKAAFDAVLADAPLDITAPIDAVLAVRKPRGVWQPALIAASLALVVGFGFGQVLAPTPNAPPLKKPGWLAVVASYQNLYSAKTLEGVNPDATEIAGEVQRVASALGTELSPDQLVLQGLSFKRGQVLSFNGKALAQFMYQSENGTPIALCLIASGAEDKAISTKQIGGLNAAIWRKNGFAYLVIGDETAETLARLAAEFESQI